jgi:hypothetical protein
MRSRLNCRIAARQISGDASLTTTATLEILGEFLRAVVHSASTRFMSLRERLASCADLPSPRIPWNAGSGPTPFSSLTERPEALQRSSWNGCPKMRQNPLMIHGDRPVIIAVIPMWMMQVFVNQVVKVITVGNGLM